MKQINIPICIFLQQILALRLLRAVLPAWDSIEPLSRTQELVEKLFTQLGMVMLECAADCPPFMQGEYLNQHISG